MLIGPSCVRHLAGQHLRGDGVHAVEDLAPILRDRAIAAVGLGCDHASGEQIVAVIDDSIHPQVFLGALITDRRYAWRNMQGRGVIRWDEVERIEVSEGLLVARQLCVMRDGRRMQVPPAGIDLGGFFHALSEVPPASRSLPPAPISQPTPGDPTGARAAKRDMLHPDSRHGSLYTLVRRIYRGSESVAGRMCTDAITGLHHTTYAGRGAQGGWWTSPLTSGDLRHAFEAMLDAPVSLGEHDGHRFMDFDVPLSWRTDATLRAGTLQRETLGKAGFGRDIARIRVTLRDRAFVVQGWDGAQGRTLDLLNPSLLAKLFVCLLEIEHRTVLRRVLAGGVTPIRQLVAQPLATLAAARRVEPESIKAVGIA
jgi:hypothetical protein